MNKRKVWNFLFYFISSFFCVGGGVEMKNRNMRFWISDLSGFQIYNDKAILV